MILSSLLYLTFFLFSLGQIGRISFFGQQINGYWYELSLFLILIHLFVKYSFLPLREVFKHQRIILLFFIYLIISFCLGILAYSVFENTVGFLYLCRLILYGFFGLYLFHWVKKDIKNNRILIRGISIFIFLTIIFSLSQYALYPDLRNLLYVGWDPHLYRMFGTLLDTSVAGAIYGLLFMFIYLSGDKIIKNKYLLISTLGILLICIVLTYSRNLYLAIFLSVGLYITSKKKYKELIFMILIFFMILFFSPKPFGEGVNLTRLFSIQSRAVDYQNALKIWQRKPLIGIGYNRIRYEKIKLNIIEEINSDVTHSGASFHSSFLIILVTAGVIGLILFLFFLLRLAAINEFNKYGIIFLGLMSMSDNIILHSFIIFLFIPLTIIYSFNRARK